MKKLAAIDIGSNAVRLAIAEYDGDKLTITKKVRVPLRLGSEAFEFGRFSEHTIKYAAKLLDVEGVVVLQGLYHQESV